jgi:hypothetical protein
MAELYNIGSTADGWYWLTYTEISQSPQGITDVYQETESLFSVVDDVFIAI